MDLVKYLTLNIKLLIMQCPNKEMFDEYLLELISQAHDEFPDQVEEDIETEAFRIVRELYK